MITWNRSLLRKRYRLPQGSMLPSERFRQGWVLAFLHQKWSMVETFGPGLAVSLALAFFSSRPSFALANYPGPVIHKRTCSVIVQCTKISGVSEL